MLQPENLDVSAFYKKKLDAKKSVMVSVYTSDKGSRTHLRITTTGSESSNVGDFIIVPEDIDKVAEFVKECGEAFKQLVAVNGAFLKEKTDGKT